MPGGAAVDLVHPGPLENHVLHLQNSHRSQQIWKNDEAVVLKCRRGGRDLFRITEGLDPRVIACLDRAGFTGAYRMGYVKIDHHLMTSLVERWRPETHTFHLTCGEATVTLQDISILTGLQVDGQAVTGSDLSKTKALELCKTLLGSEPPPNELDGIAVSLTWLRGIISNLPPDASDHLVSCQARACILYMLGGYLMPHKSGSHTPIHPLALLEDLDACGQMAWGAAVLAYLYRELCRATLPNADGLAGGLVILQIWAWERIRILTPQIIDNAPLQREIINRAPRARRWACHSVNVLQHSLRHYRDQLDQMKKEQMVWQPYSADIIEALPSYCLQGQLIWRARVPLIYYDIVEYHFPDRVMRQFGLRQDKPQYCDTKRDLHATDRRGRGKYDWRAIHMEYCNQWEARTNYICEGEPFDGRTGYMDPYMVWFRRITRLKISPPVQSSAIGFATGSVTQSILADALSKIVQVVDRHLSTDTRVDDEAIKALARIRDICHEHMECTLGIDRFAEVPTPVSYSSTSIPEEAQARAKGVVARHTKRKTCGT